MKDFIRMHSVLGLKQRQCLAGPDVSCPMCDAGYKPIQYKTWPGYQIFFLDSEGRENKVLRDPSTVVRTVMNLKENGNVVVGIEEVVLNWNPDPSA